MDTTKAHKEVEYELPIRALGAVRTALAELVDRPVDEAEARDFIALLSESGYWIAEPE